MGFTEEGASSLAADEEAPEAQLQATGGWLAASLSPPASAVGKRTSMATDKLKLTISLLLVSLLVVKTFLTHLNLCS